MKNYFRNKFSILMLQISSSKTVFFHSSLKIVQNDICKIEISLINFSGFIIYILNNLKTGIKYLFSICWPESLKHLFSSTSLISRVFSRTSIRFYMTEGKQTFAIAQRDYYNVSLFFRMRAICLYNHHRDPQTTV